jgi:polyhydroxybutyrate depolymerase
MPIRARDAVLASFVMLACAGTSGGATVGCASDDESGATPDGDATTAGNEGGSAGEGGTMSGPDGAAPDGTTPSTASCTGKLGVAGDKPVTLVVGGRERAFDLHVPAKYDTTKRTPLVFLFHGYTQTAAEIATATHFAETADARGMIVAFPSGISNSFNAGDCCGTAVNESIDDVDFTRAMITKIDGEYCVDAKRVFATGFSNGGYFAYFLACELSDQIAAVAPVSGGLRVDPAACKPKRPVPLLHIHGTNDVVVPYNGGGFGNARPVSESVGAFRTKNGCAAGDGKVVFTKDDVSCTKWDGCTADADVELCTVTGGGHQWPGGDTFPLYGGSTSQTIKASEVVADFFEAHPMP